MQPIQALILLLAAFVGLLTAVPVPTDLQWRQAMFPSRAMLLMKRKEERVRNCFFSPVQCLLPIDSKAFRKFVPQK